MSLEDDDFRSPTIRVANTTFAKIVFLKTMKSLGIFLAIILLVYVCFAATILRVVPTSEAGLIPVKNITFTGGIVPPGREVVVDTEEPQGSGIFDRLKQSFVPNSNAAVVRVVSDPIGKLKWVQPNILMVDGEPVGVPMSPLDKDGNPRDFSGDNGFLKDEYVAECIKGACVEGEALIIPSENIMGIPLFNSSDEDGSE